LEIRWWLSGSNQRILSAALLVKERYLISCLNSSPDDTAIRIHLKVLLAGEDTCIKLGLSIGDYKRQVGADGLENNVM